MRRLALIAVPLVAAACVPAPVTVSPPPDGATASVSQPVTGTPAPTPAFFAPPASGAQTALSPVLVDIDTRGCVPNDPRVGASSLCSTFLQADLVGDGTPQDLVFYVAGTASRRPLAEARWTVELRTAAGTWKTTLPGGITSGTIALLGVADANGDGRPDAFLNIGHGASTTWAGLLTFDGRELTAVVLDPMLLIGGSVRHQDAIECRSVNGRMELVHRQISNYTADDQWDVVEYVYAWSGSALALATVLRSDFRVPANFAGPPSGSYYGGIRCGSLRLPA